MKVDDSSGLQRFARVIDAMPVTATAPEARVHEKTAKRVETARVAPKTMAKNCVWLGARRSGPR
jgi:hypothetical protein